MIDFVTFRSVMGRFASGISIVTARDEEGNDHGMTVSAFSSVSLNPPMVLVCVDEAASMYDLLRRTQSLGISILSSDQEAISRRFADPEYESFDGLAYSRGENGVVLLEDSLAQLECRIVRYHDAGDHMILLAEVDRATPRDGRPLLYYRGGYAQLER